MLVHYDIHISKIKNSKKVSDRMDILKRLIAEGHVKIVDGSYVGIASDGVEVNLGVVHSPAYTLAYLADFPSPTMW